MTVRHAGQDGNRRDANEAEIVAAMRRCGASVVRMSIPGAPDLLVGFRGNTFLVEVKAPKGKLTGPQEHWIMQWRGGDVHVVRTIDDALRLLGVIAPTEAL